MEKQKKKKLLGYVLPVQLLLVVGMFGVVWHTHASRQTDRSKDKSSTGEQDSKKTDNTGTDADKKKEVTVVTSSSSAGKSSSAKSSSAKSSSTGKSSSAGKSSSTVRGQSGGKGRRDMSAGEMGTMPTKRGPRRNNTEQKEEDISDMSVEEYNQHLNKKMDEVTTKKEPYSQRFTEFTGLVEDTKPQVTDADHKEKKELWERFRAGLKEALNV